MSLSFARPSRRPAYLGYFVLFVVMCTLTACADESAPGPASEGTLAPLEASRATTTSAPVELSEAAPLSPTKGDPAGAWSTLPAPIPQAWVASPPACTAEDWLAKYLHYRKRFRGARSAGVPGFVSFGTGPGESLPAAGRNPDTLCTADWHVNDAGCGYEDWQTAQGSYAWGDTTIWLGTWLAQLASEHAVFTRLGLDTSETASDLQLAMAAFDRLDQQAERDFGRPPRYDGFFRRDDISEGFYELPDGSPRFPDARIPGGAFSCVAGTCDPPTVEGGSYMSGDQVIGMLFGLALVHELVPETASANGVPLRYKARTLVHRIAKYLVDNGYRVTAPDGTRPPNEWGGDVTAFAHQIGELANHICGDDFGVSNYATVAGVWGGADLSWSVQSGINQSMMMKLAALNATWSPDKMAWRAAERRAELFPFVQAVLHDQPVGAEMADWKLEELLTSAPCGGPCTGTSGCEEAHGWRGPDRVNSGEYREGSFYGAKREFNGLDYMLLHNFYLLAKEGRYDVRVHDQVATTCGGYTSLDAALAGNASSYDPNHACAGRDLSRRFCGRSLARWIDAAQRGEARIYSVGRRWSCVSGAACTLVADSVGRSEGADLILGSPLNDVLDGGGGSDCIYGFGGDDTLRGGRAFDELHGGDGRDTLYGEGPSLTAEGESDRLFGEAGDDVLYGNQGNDDLYGGAGNDLLDAGNGHDVALGGEGDDVIHGGERSDTIEGGPGADTIDGGIDPDRIEGGDGDDRIIGGAGADRIHAGAGHDVISAGEGADFIAAGEGDDTIDAGPGDDRQVYGEGGRNAVYGGEGDDVLYGGGERDKMDGGPGRDVLFGGAGVDLLRGGLGDDTLRGEGADDRLCGNEGDDVLDGGAGHDACRGGWGGNSYSACDSSALTFADCEPAAFTAWP